MPAPLIAEFHPRRTGTAALGAALLLAALLCAGLALGDGLPALDWSQRRFGVEVQRTVWLLLATFSLLVGLELVWQAASRRPTLAVDGDGLVVWTFEAGALRVPWSEVREVEVLGDPRSGGASLGIHLRDVEAHLATAPLLRRCLLRLNARADRPAYLLAGMALDRPVADVADLLRRELRARA
jgi:hypothetical protein